MAKVQRLGQLVKTSKKDFVKNLRTTLSKSEGAVSPNIIPQGEQPKEARTDVEREAAKKQKQALAASPEVSYTISDEERMMNHVIGKMRLGRDLTTEEETFVQKIIGD